MSRRETFQQLKQSAPGILPSLLMCDFGNLQREVERLQAAGAPALHLDVMDGNFVPNITYGLPITAALRRLTTLPLDVHLMIDRPNRYLSQFYEAGADAITIHVEASPDPTSDLQAIRRLGAAAGLALNPATPLADIEPHLDACDMVLVMSVPAGFGGQAFDPSALDKLRRLSELVGDRCLLEIDGGVNLQTIGACTGAGAELLVVGSAIFRNPDYGQAISELQGVANASFQGY
ncbi:MAG: ribulose-phosphate 3-epimerase [Pirellulales bacterium]